MKLSKSPANSGVARLCDEVLAVQEASLSLHGTGSRSCRARLTISLGTIRKARVRNRTCSHFARVEGASDVAGLSMVVYGNPHGVEYDLRLAPGADASKLRLDFLGRSEITSVDSDRRFAARHWRQ